MQALGVVGTSQFPPPISLGVEKVAVEGSSILDW